MKKKTLKVVLCVCTLLVLLLAIIFPKATWAYLVELVLALAVIGILAFNASEKNNAGRVILIVKVGIHQVSFMMMFIVSTQRKN